MKEKPIRNLGENPRGQVDDTRDLANENIGRFVLGIKPLDPNIERIYQSGVVAETEHRMYAHLTGYTPELTEAEKRQVLEAKLSTDPEPEIRGETTFGLNPKWIDWYCRVNNTAVWKARKAGKEKLRKLQALVNRFNK